MNKLSRGNRIASLGLALVLLSLTVFSVCATIITLQVLNRARESSHMSNIYQQAHYGVSLEDSLMHQYYIDSTASNWAEYQASAIQLVATFHTIERDGDNGDRAFMARALLLQEQFHGLALQMFTAIAARQMTMAKTIHDGTIDAVFDQLEARVNQAAAADHIQTNQSVDQLNQTQQTIIISTSVIFAASLLLLMFFWRMLRAYQQQLQLSAQERLIQMERTASTDSLTGLFNHRAIVEKIEEELARCCTTQRNCAIIFVDVDHFKHINDTWGHSAGDAALFTVGQRLREGIRQDDVLGRYGGEEFAILLTDIEQLEAVALAEQLRCSLAGQPLLWKQEKTQSELSIQLTASFGLAVYPLDGITSKGLLERADTAMYHAKHGGRNRVCTPEEEDFELPEVDTQKQQSEQSQDHILAKALYAQETRAHTLQMQYLAEATTQVLGRSTEEVLLMHVATALYDIGKIGVPEAILHKSGPLTREDWAVMRLHPYISQQILAQIGERFGLISHIVMAHHERWDGQGYPHGLAGEEIPLGARILAVVDSYSAMTSWRPYREARSAAEAREELRRGAGNRYDPHVVEAFLQILQEPSISALTLQPHMSNRSANTETEAAY